MLQIGVWYFKPKWIMTLMTLLGLIILIALGYWQLNRAAEKRQLQHLYQQRLAMPPLTLSEIKNNSDNQAYRRIKLRGSFDNQHQFLLDNKFYQHKIGYHVVTPLVIAEPFCHPSQACNARAGIQVILVDRGWIAQGRTRDVLPVIAPVIGQQTITGIIIFPSKKNFLLGDIQENQNTWPQRIQQLDLQKIQTILGREIFPFIVELAPREITVMSPARHIAYAFQWFALAFVLFIIFIAVNIKRTHET